MELVDARDGRTLYSTAQREGSQTPDAGQIARSALHSLNCSLDRARESVLTLIPKQRGLASLLPSRSLRPKRAAGASNPARRPVSLRGSPFAAAIPGDTVVEQVFTSGISSFLNLYNTALIGRIILTWFPAAPQAIVGPLSTLCDPYLNLFRGIIPPLGGTLDLSPVLAFVALDLFINAAGALPCELGPDGEMKRDDRRNRILTPSQGATALRRHLAAKRQRRQEVQQKRA